MQMRESRGSHGALCILGNRGEDIFPPLSKRHGKQSKSAIGKDEKNNTHAYGIAEANIFNL